MEVEGEEEGMATRIFVGGLGGSVTAGDLEKTFSSLGVVKSVEIVRTNGRSFAYMDFQPSSPKSLSKLFSMYNGCVWKGGRLKLEKAKEHYLIRLKREWAEDAELESTAERASKAPKDESIADKNLHSSEKLKSLAEEKLQVHIYFPGLRKVKSLPYRGSGKHKYSFQRIQVPSMPIHFCDCEEHCGPLETAKEKHVYALETQNEATTEEELNMMRSVMDKILKRESNSRTGYDGMKMDSKGEDSNQPNDDVLVVKSEAGEEPYEDDLVINMVSGGNERLNQEMQTISADMGSKFSKRGLSDGVPATNKLNAQKRKDTELFSSSNPTSNKKARLLLGEANNQDESAHTKPKKNSSLKTLAEESKNAAEDQPPEQKESIQQSNKELSWIQKSSWKKMVGGTKTNFSISQILANTSTKENIPESTDLHCANLNDRKHQNIKQSSSKFTRDNLKDMELDKEGRLQNNFSVGGGSTVAPSNETSRDSEKPTGADEKTGFHESIGKEGSSQDKVNSADGPTLLFNTTSQDYEGLKEAEQNSSAVQMIGKEGNLQDKVSTSGDSIMAPSSISSKDSERPTKAKLTDEEASIVQSTGGVSWIQKSAWKDLVGEANHNSFSISHILPGVNSTSGKVPDSKNSGPANSSAKKQKNSDKQLSIGSTEDASKNSGPANSSARKQKNSAKQLSIGSTEDASKTYGIDHDGDQQDKVSIAGGLIMAPSDTNSKDLEGPREANLIDEEAGIKQSTGGASWLQKSSWRELVGETNQSSFSISNFLPGVKSSTTGKMADAKSSGTANSSGSKQKNLANSSGIQKDGALQDKVNAPSGSKRITSEVEDEIRAGLKVEFNVLGKNSQDDNNASKTPESKSHGDANEKAIAEPGIGEVCTFMRSALSEKQWTKAKTALSGSLKKKSAEK